MRVKLEVGGGDMDAVWRSYRHHRSSSHLFYVPTIESDFFNVHSDNPKIVDLQGKIAWIKNNVYWAEPPSDEEVHALLHH